MLKSLHSYYLQFSPHIRSSLLAQKASISKKLSDSVRLAKWDEQSYYSLAESSEKNHRGLNKFLREYDAVLGSPAGRVVEREVARGVRDGEGGGKGVHGDTGGEGDVPQGEGGG